LSDSATRAARLRQRCITGFGSGYGPVAPATWGSLVATVLFTIPAGVLLWVGAATSTSLHWVVDVALLLPGILFSAGLSVYWGEWAIDHFNSRDPRPFVLDEFAGQWIALLALPPAALAGPGEFAAVVLGQFVLFRIFDVLKVPPARQVERLPGGWGVLCDDLIAGLYANIVGQIIWRYTALPAALGL
jgi:phosphatidylglycerophosphatase A